MVAVTRSANPEPGGADEPADRELLQAHARALADAVERAIPGWIERSVERGLGRVGREIDAGLRAHVIDAAAAAQREGSERLRELLDTDVDQQRTNPLALLRSLVRFPTSVLQAAGVPPVDRDEFARRSFPDDLYDLSPASFADIDPQLHEPGLVWGAAKAHVVLARRRREGRR